MFVIIYSLCTAVIKYILDAKSYYLALKQNKYR